MTARDHIGLRDGFPLLSSAAYEAQRLQHERIGTDALLLGLLRTRESIAAKSLNFAGVTTRNARTEIERRVGKGTHIYTRRKMFLPFTKEFQKLLDCSWEEAKRLNQDLIESEHFLLALVAEDSSSQPSVPESVARQVLKELRVDLSSVRARVLRFIEERETSGSDAVTRRKITSADFTERAKKLVLQAIEEARSSRQECVSNEQILIALINEREDLAGSILGEHGLDVHDVRNRVHAYHEFHEPDPDEEKFFRRLISESIEREEARTSEENEIIEKIIRETPTVFEPNESSPPGVSVTVEGFEFPMSRSALRAFRSSLSPTAKNVLISPEDLLLGLLRTDHLIAFDVLDDLKIDFDKVEAELLERQSGGN